MSEPSESKGARATGANEIDETAVRASVIVNASIERSFQVFTEGMSSWWPRTHHIATAPMLATLIEPRVGGRWFELGDDGTECDWGVVLAWDPPHHFAVSWHLDGDFRHDPDARRSSRVDVQFRRQADGTTHVQLVHSGLDRHGPTWRRLRDAVGASGGWPGMLRRFSEAVVG